MKRLALLVALPLLAISCSPKNPSDPKFVVAEGKGIKITRAELDKAVDEQLQQMRIPTGQIPMDQLKKMIEPQALEGLIDLKLVLNGAEKAGLKDVNKKVEEQFALATKGMDKAELDKKLAEANLTEATVKENIKKRIMIQEFIASISTEPAVTDEQADAFYKKHEDKFVEPELVTVQQILVQLPQGASPAEKAAKEKIIKDARARIAKGEAFETVAAEVGEDSSKANGGMMDPFTKGDQSPEFEKVAFTSKVDVLSPVFSTERGLHILKVKKRTPQRSLPFAEVKDWIKGKLGEEEKSKAAQAYLEKMRKEADVKILLPKAEAPEGAAAPAGPAVQMVEPAAK